MLWAGGVVMVEATVEEVMEVVVDFQEVEVTEVMVVMEAPIMAQEVHRDLVEAVEPAL
jgi:hypothetical protein